MRRYLIVANQTLPGDPLLGRGRECVTAVVAGRAAA